MKLSDSPQTRHNAKRRELENGGILRVLEGAISVARTAGFDRIPESVGI
jgi:hypothetical protein